MRFFDLCNLIGLIAIVTGIDAQYGWPYAAMVGGALLIALNFRVAKLMSQ